MNKPVIVFDLDDTLIYEIDYLKSAYYEIAGLLDENNKEEVYDKMLTSYFKGINVFNILISQFPKINMEDLLRIYRNHKPTLQLKNYSLEILNYLKKNKCIIGLITDGRSITQRNKLKATKIENYFDLIIISEEFASEKPNVENYRIFHNFRSEKYYYVADNTKKDFVTPNKLNWETICLLDIENKNIHKQDFKLSKEYLPKYKIESLLEIKKILNIETFI